MADSISIVMTMKSDIDAKMKTIASTTQDCSKAFEEFKRRTEEVKGQLDALNKEIWMRRRTMPARRKMFVRK